MLEFSYGVVDVIECVLVGWLLFGDCVVVENLCFFGSFNMLWVVGYVMVVVLIDEEGM